MQKHARPGTGHLLKIAATGKANPVKFDIRDRTNRAQHLKELTDLTEVNIWHPIRHGSVDESPAPIPNQTVGIPAQLERDPFLKDEPLSMIIRHDD